MSHFHYDFSKTGAFDITNGADTVTINSVKHIVDVCVCENCKKIVAAKKAAAAKKEEWTYKYVYTPPAPAPAPKPCCHHHCHCHH